MCWVKLFDKGLDAKAGVGTCECRSAGKAFSRMRPAPSMEHEVDGSRVFGRPGPEGSEGLFCSSRRDKAGRHGVGGSIQGRRKGQPPVLKVP